MSINSVNEFWKTVKNSFLFNDGSLPGIELFDLEGNEVPSIFEKVLLYGDLSSESSFWHKEKETDVAVNSVSNAAKLVVEGKADSFHFCINNVKYRGCELPVIGIFIFTDSIEFDFRMGPEWSKNSVLSFFKFLLEMKRESKNGRFKGEAVAGPEDMESILCGLEWVESEYFA